MMQQTSFIIGGLAVEIESGDSHRTLWCYEETANGIGFNLEVHYDWKNAEWVLDEIRDAVQFDADHNETPLDDHDRAQQWWDSSVDEFNEELGEPIEYASLPEKYSHLW